MIDVMISRRKHVCILLIALVLLSLAALPETSFAGSKPKLKKKITMTVGEKTKLKVKNYKRKVIWKSSNAYVAKVSKKGVVKARHNGCTVISAQCKSTILKCYVTVKLSSSSYRMSNEKKPKPYISCYEVDHYGKTIESGNSYNLGVINGYYQTWTWTTSDPDLAVLLVDGKSVVKSSKEGRYCQLVKTFNSKTGKVLITAQSGTTVLQYMLVIHPSADDCKYMQMRTQILSEVISPGMSAQEQCLAVAKWISDYASYSVTDGPYYSLLSNKVGQCYHYAVTFDFLMDGTSIPCDYVRTAAHAWNQVKIDGQWYNIDVTGIDNDNYYNQPYNYRYFLVSDKLFWRKDKRVDSYHQCVSARYDFNIPYDKSPWATGTWKKY